MPRSSSIWVVKNEKNTCPICQAEIFDTKDDLEGTFDSDRAPPELKNIAEVAANIGEIELEAKGDSLLEQEKPGISNPKPSVQVVPDIDEYQIASRRNKRIAKPNIDKLRESELYRQMLQSYVTLKDRNLALKLKSVIDFEVLKKNE